MSVLSRWLMAAALALGLAAPACLVETDLVPRAAEVECYGDDTPPGPGSTPGDVPGGDAQAADGVCAGVEEVAPSAPAAGGGAKEWECPYVWVKEDGDRLPGKRRQPAVTWETANELHKMWCEDKSRTRKPQRFECGTCAREPASSGDPPFNPGGVAPSSDDLKDRTCTTVGECVVGTDVQPHQYVGTYTATTEADARTQNESAFYRTCNGVGVIAETDCSNRGVADDAGAAAARYLCTGTMVCQAQGSTDPDHPRYKELSCIHRPPGTAVRARDAAAAGNVLARRCGQMAIDETGWKFWVCGTRPSVDGPWLCKPAGGGNG